MKSYEKYSFVMPPLMVPWVSYIHFEVNSIVEWTPGKIRFGYDLQRCHELRTFASKRTEFWNGLMLKIIHFWCDIQYCHQLQTLMSKWTQLLNVLLIQIIHIWCDIQCCHKPYRFTLKWTQLLNELLREIFICYATFNGVISWLHSLRSEFNCGTDSDWLLSY